MRVKVTGLCLEHLLQVGILEAIFPHVAFAINVGSLVWCLQLYRAADQGRLETFWIKSVLQAVRSDAQLLLAVALIATRLDVLTVRLFFRCDLSPTLLYHLVGSNYLLLGGLYIKRAHRELVGRLAFSIMLCLIKAQHISAAITEFAHEYLGLDHRALVAFGNNLEVFPRLFLDALH